MVFLVAMFIFISWYLGFTIGRNKTNSELRDIERIVRKLATGDFKVAVDVFGVSKGVKNLGDAINDLANGLRNSFEKIRTKIDELENRSENEFSKKRTILMEHQKLEREFDVALTTNKKLEEAATLDPLTGIFNRYYLQKRFAYRYLQSILLTETF